MSIRNFSSSMVVILSSVIFCLVSPSWYGVWLGMELNLFGAILFLVTWESRTLSSGFKYYFIQAFGSSVIVISIVVGGWGSQGVAVSGLLCGIGVKLGAAPFHFWVVEVLDSIRPVCMWFVLTVQKLVPFCCVCQGFHGGWSLPVLSGLSAIFGAASGLGAIRLSRFLGYSSVAHTGWGLAACLGGLKVLIYYLLAYWISLSGYLSLVGGDGYLFVMSGGAVRRPPFSVGTCFFLLSLGGFPPFIGFFAKVAVLTVVLSWYSWLGIVLVVSSCISWTYYIYVMAYGILRGSSCFQPLKSDRSGVVAVILSVPYFHFLDLLF